jgi:hypothetical protein
LNKKGGSMKSSIFSEAINNRNRIVFLYNLEYVMIDPYFTIEEKGKMFIYGKTSAAPTIKKYEYSKIANIKIIKNRRFTPIIPAFRLAG